MTDAKNFFSTYSDFVTKVTSEPSLDLKALQNSLESIHENPDIDVPRLLTGALGLGSETGEFVEIVKKMVLQGKPASEDKYLSYETGVGRHHVVLGNSLHGSWVRSG